MNPVDYIDWDEGRDFAAPVVELPVCDSCHKAADCLTYLPDWDMFSCATCVRAADEQEQECTCQRIDVDLYDAHGCAAHERKVA
jgi:hypothetical protein